MSSSKVDILMINESKLDSTLHNNEVYLPDFELVRRDRRINGRHSGGVCIYLRSNLNYRIRDDLGNDGLDCLLVEKRKPRSTSFLVGTCYRPQALHLIFNVSSNKIFAKIDAENKELYIYTW